MRFTDIFVRRPVLSICLSLLILFSGMLSLQSLNVRQYPRSDVAEIVVTTAYVGADANLVQGFITSPLERAIASADGIDYLQSSSKQGLSTITARLRLNFDANSALTQIQSKVNQVRNDLPPEAEVPVITLQSADNRIASMYLSFYADELAPNQITDYLLRVVQPKLSSVPGVEKADILGARTFAMRIWLKADEMAARNISPAMVRDALSRNNYLSAPGQTRGAQVSFNLVATTDLQSAEEFKDLVVSQQGDATVRLVDIADIELGAENYDEDVRFNGQEAVFMGIWVMPNANTIDVIQSARSTLSEIENNLPEGMYLSIPYDSSAYIQDAIDEVIFALGETIAIVIVVIFLFLGSFRSVLIPIVAIPLSLVGAGLFMIALGFSLNLLTLLAIVLAVGLVVDDAIVMLENCERHVAEGLSPLEAAYKGARELAFPITVMTLTLAAVYAPIGLQGGLTGTLFREFAFTLAGAVIVSGITALTLSPMMASFLVRKNENPSPLKQKIDKGFEALRDRYSSSLLKIFHYRTALSLTSLFLIVLIIPMYMFSMKELAPDEDQSIVFGIIQAAPNATLEQTTTFTEMVYERFTRFPEHARVFQLTFPSGGFSGMQTVPWSEREKGIKEILGETWAVMSDVPGIQVIALTPATLPGGSDFPVEFIFSSTDSPERLFQYVDRFVGAAFASGKFMFADSDLRFDLPQSRIVIDRDKVALMGLDMRQVGLDLATFTGGNFVNRFNIEGRSYKVIPQAERIARLKPDQLLDMFTVTPSGERVPFSAFAHIEERVQPRELKRFQQLNSVMIQGAVVPGVTVDQGLQVLEELAAEILPKEYVVDYAGESRQLRTEGDTLTGTLIAALIVIFLLLAAQFESFRDPFIILGGSVPLALAGALVFVFLDFTSLNIYSQVGLVTLVGLVSKNGILIVEFANALREEGYEMFDAIIESARTRFRPVMMTSVATVVGHTPLIFASGPGAAARNSIGWVLVMGMLIGTFFTLFVVPVLYTLLSSKERSMRPLPEEDTNVISSHSDSNGVVGSGGRKKQPEWQEQHHAHKEIHGH